MQPFFGAVIATLGVYLLLLHHVILEWVSQRFHEPSFVLDETVHVSADFMLVVANICLGKSKESRS